MFLSFLKKCKKRIKDIFEFIIISNTYVILLFITLVSIPIIIDQLFYERLKNADKYEYQKVEEIYQKYSILRPEIKSLMLKKDGKLSKYDVHEIEKKVIEIDYKKLNEINDQEKKEIYGRITR